MKAIDWIAVFGALAWLPALWALLRPLFTRARVRIITEKRVMISFNNWGPSVGIRIAFATDRRDAVVTNLRFSLKHEDGEQRTFEWQRISQHMAQFNIPNTGSVPFVKVSGVLALKLSTSEIAERFIQFQTSQLIAEIDERAQKLFSKFRHSLSTGFPSVEQFMATEEATDYFTNLKQSFNWKAGDYTLSFEIESPEKCLLKDTEYKFTLTPSDIKFLEDNKATVETEFTNRLATMARLPTKRFVWLGRNVVLSRVEG